MGKGKSVSHSKMCGVWCVWTDTELLTGNTEALVTVCPVPVEIMRHTVECDVESFVKVGLEYANEVGPGNRSALGYEVLDIVNDFLDSAKGTTPVNDVWGYYSQETGMTLAVVGAGNGVSILDTTVPQAPVSAAFFKGYFSIWRDHKAYSNYIYSVHDSMYGQAFIDSLTNVDPTYLEPYKTGDGLSVIDVSFPRTPKEVKRDNSDFEFAHNIFIETDRPYAYVCGGDVTKGMASAGGIRVYDLSDPENPVSIATWGDFYVHDLVVQYREDAGYVLYACGINETPPNPSLFLLGVNDPAGAGVETISIWPTTYKLTHNAWPTLNNEYLYVTHEDIGSPVTIFDIRDVHAVKEVNEIYIVKDNDGVSAHNAFVKGEDELWISYYTEGVVVYDISDPVHPVVAGQYDTSHLKVGFGGAWGVWPGYGDPNPYIYVSDMQHGLFVIEPKDVTPAAPSPIPAPAKTSLAGPYAVSFISLFIGFAAAAGLAFIVIKARSSGGAGAYVAV